MNYNELLFFGVFLLIISFLLYVDLGLVGKKNHVISLREGTFWTALWVAVSVGFYIFIRFHGTAMHGLETPEDIQFRIDKFNHPIQITGLSFEQASHLYNINLALEYITGYLIEYSLSVDNVFVIAMIFISFGVEQRYYKKVLFWGILGAIVMRFFFIFAASALIQRFWWVLLFFGALLIALGIKMFIDFLHRHRKKEIDINNHPVVRFSSRIFRVSKEPAGNRFWIRKDGLFYITPLFITLLVIEFSDVIFAVDSVPAVFSVTKDPYIVFFSNIFAILGLRSLFFVVMNIINRFEYLRLGLSVLLVFVGLKMTLHEIHRLGFDFHFNLSTENSFYIIILILVSSILLSLAKNAFGKRRKRKS
ncbi:MAG: TerC/Alx family metal homeostasis membrane protein [Bacteroidetes bacterium]|nr:TerC/Alx family metal homeostasis membrane protein [Bacteroidota bacterium]